MGRVLLIAAAALAAACGPASPGEDVVHAELACAACHDGERGERGRATVPESSCLESGCHEGAVPQSVTVGTVTFSHRDHAEGHAIEATCAGCHTHASGEDPLRATVDACALCHIGQVAGSRGEECRVCHQTPDHAALTSQGVVVSHSALPWVEAGCVRCHYDVADPPTEVAAAKCRQCHTDLGALNQAAVGRDLHPIHDGVSCTACHEAGTHHVRAMSSAVELVCGDCHRSAHQLSLVVAEADPTAVCADCHAGVHAPQQQLLLGIVPGTAAAPSGKFLAGITCRSCHIPTAAGSDPATAIRGQAEACAGCHEQEYERVLDWWLEGTRARLASTAAYVTEGARRLGAREDSAGRKVREAGTLVALVSAAGGQHNLELSDRLLRQALEQVRSAYAAAGLRPPQPPDLGAVPHAGLCSYCHYRRSEPWDMDAMSDAFHRRVMGRD
ncbi:MAG TPA: cytochrome c3 family protein [Longimicrobiales bacterium]|nr:cytochrome c3 family protein [Longimicrobiales bacterium]